MPGGARFFKCALQVNPYAYIVRHKKPDPFGNERSYNRTLIKALLAEGVEAICITDHYQVQTAEPLRIAAAKAGIHVFPGFEAATKDGVHLLCIFEANKDVDALERIVGECGVIDNEDESPLGIHDALEFLTHQKRWGAVCVAAHVASSGGLLRKVTGKTRAAIWKSPDLLACALPGPASAAPAEHRDIVLNKDVAHKRDRKLAVINANDISSPEGVSADGAWCWIKMVEPSVSGLRQAFIDPTSRIRLASDPEPDKHAEFVAVAWEGGFLDGMRLRFNENLNVLVGGRGAGKSTVVESLRFVLGMKPVGDEAKVNHRGVVQRVLRNGTKVSLLVASHHPASSYYVIERTVPDPPIVKDEAGQILDLKPQDVAPNVEIFGQHEIAEMARSPEKLTRLLKRFVPSDDKFDSKKKTLKGKLAKSKNRLLDAIDASDDVEQDLAKLPSLEEILKGFVKAGLEKKLQERTFVVKEQQILDQAMERISETLVYFFDSDEDGEVAYEIDTDFLLPDELSDLPGLRTLSKLEPILRALEIKIVQALTDVDEACTGARKQLDDVVTTWDVRKTSVERNYKKTLRALQKDGIDGEAYIRVTADVEQLRPLKGKQISCKKELRSAEKDRRKLLQNWQDLKASEFRTLERAAKKVSAKLKNRVRVKVTYAGERSSLVDALDGVSGRLSEVKAQLRDRKDLSIPVLVEKWNEGAEALAKYLKVPKAQAEKLVESPIEYRLDVEAVDLPATTSLELNTAPEGETPAWQSLSDLSTGQKATAVLLLTLLESDAPLIVDQPEDDLDNRFITESVVPRMREEKRRRQFIFTSHNANIPVLGDAELIAGLDAVGEADDGNASVQQQAVGSIDSDDVRRLIEEILEGGRDAFEMRRTKYGY